MTDLIAEVTAALERSVLPSVIARGAAVRVAAAIGTAGQAARALGLTTGPVHAELRVDTRGGQPAPAMLGGLCSRALRLPGGKTLEELVLANALGQPVPAVGHDPARPSGVFMLPVPRPGRAPRGRGPRQRRSSARDHRLDHHYPGRPAGTPAPGRRPVPGFHLR